MILTFLRLLTLTVLLALLLPIVVAVCSRLLEGPALGPTFLGKMVVLILLALGGALWIGRRVDGLRPRLESLADAQARFLDHLPLRQAPAAIVVSAALSLFLELAIIRWQGTEWELFAFYKNFSLLACFLGLGLGYALARKGRIPAVLVLPLLAFQLLYLTALRHAIPQHRLVSLQAMPITEQLNMGLHVPTQVPHYVAVYAFLAVVILLTALAFLPVGQICGRVLDRLPHLKAYGWNLVGSILGVALMFAASFLWTPPLVWFALSCVALAWLQIFDRRALLAGLVASFVITAVLAWPVAFGWERIYSPYQLLERGRGEHGLMLIRAAGHYYQRVHDLSAGAQHAYPDRRAVAAYYDLPYRLHPRAQRIAIVGAGTGNDVAAALRGGASRVDAIEIDPAILALGASYHPERPYRDRRVTRG